eukprot:4630430-Prymnesium_polylepis.2
MQRRERSEVADAHQPVLNRGALEAATRPGLLKEADLHGEDKRLPRSSTTVQSFLRQGGRKV